MVDNDRRRRPIRIGISACLLGQQVRFDGGSQAGRVLRAHPRRALPGGTALYLEPHPKELMLRKHV